MGVGTEDSASRSDKGPEQPVSLVIPCKPEYLSLCRLVAGAVGAAQSLDEESIADLKLVVTEACSCFLWGPDGQPAREAAAAGKEPCYLRVDFQVQANSWSVTISDPEHRRRVSPGTCDPSTEQGLRLTILKALVDTLEHTDSEAEGSIIRLTKKLF
ncbi:MAG: ATP-binding protein [Thermoleophilia bacterium]|nr:ATP-binding protein [Thermoleophilia bacterium]